MDTVFFEIGSKPLADMGVLPRMPSDIDWFGPLEYAEKAVEVFFPLGFKLHTQSPGKVVYRCAVAGVAHRGHVMVEIEDSDANENSKQIYMEMCMDLCGTSGAATKEIDEISIAVLPAQLDWLLFFKESHKFKKDSVHFLKTLNDIKLLRDIGAQIPICWHGMLEERARLTYTNKLPNLNVKAGEFFNPATVKYRYDHDSIHRAVALHGKPAYLHRGIHPCFWFQRKTVLTVL